MSKRFTDTDKWKKPWYRKLKPAYKVFWQYLLDNCDKSGIWEVDFETAAFFVGEDLETTDVKETFKKQFIEIDGGKRWFLVDYITFQYGKLNPNNSAHKNVYIELLSRKLINTQGAVKELQSTFQGAKDIYKDKDKDKDKDKEEEASETPKVILGDYDTEGDRISQFEGPSLNDVIEFYAKWELSPDEALIFWNEYESKEWIVIGQGPPRDISKNWKLKAEQWIKKIIIKKAEDNEKSSKSNRGNSNPGKGSIDQGKYKKLLSNPPAN